MAKFSLVVLAFIAAFSCTPTCFASPNQWHARRHPLAPPIGPGDWSNVSFPLTQAPPPNPSIIEPIVSPTSTCQTYSCNLFYQVSHIASQPSILTEWSSMCPSFTGRPSRRIRRAWLQCLALHHWPSLLGSLCKLFSRSPVISKLSQVVEHPRVYMRSFHLSWLVTAATKSAKATALLPHHLLLASCQL